MSSATSTITVCKLAELPQGEMRLIEADGRKIGVFHCADGGLYAIEDRCSHDDGPLAEGEFDAGGLYGGVPASWLTVRHHDGQTAHPPRLPAGGDLRGPHRRGRSEAGALILR